MEKFLVQVTSDDGMDDHQRIVQYTGLRWVLGTEKGVNGILM